VWVNSELQRILRLSNMRPAFPESPRKKERPCMLSQCTGERPKESVFAIRLCAECTEPQPARAWLKLKQRRPAAFNKAHWCCL
jgi:hypothetical protein